MDGGGSAQLLHSYLDAVWSGGDPEAARRFLAPDFRRHLSPTREPLDVDQQIARLHGFRQAFPDVTLTLEDLVIAADRVAFRSTMRATHGGEFLGVPATGRRVTVGLLDLWRVADGLVAEQWGGPDVHDLLQQLRGAPPGG